MVDGCDSMTSTKQNLMIHLKDVHRIQCKRNKRKSNNSNNNNNYNYNTNKKKRKHREINYDDYSNNNDNNNQDYTINIRSSYSSNVKLEPGKEPPTKRRKLNHYR